MSRKYKFRDQNAIYFVSFATVYWIDVFTRPLYKDIVVDSINYCIQNKGLLVYAWCLMTNHAHMIIGTEDEKLQNIMRDLKGYTSREILKAIEDNQQESRKEWMLWMMKRAGLRNGNNEKYQFWQQHNKPIVLHIILHQNYKTIDKGKELTLDVDKKQFIIKKGENVLLDAKFNEIKEIVIHQTNQYKQRTVNWFSWAAYYYYEIVLNNGESQKITRLLIYDLDKKVDGLEFKYKNYFFSKI